MKTCRFCFKFWQCYVVGQIHVSQRVHTESMYKPGVHWVFLLGGVWLLVIVHYASASLKPVINQRTLTESWRKKEIRKRERENYELVLLLQESFTDDLLQQHMGIYTMA